MKIITHNEITNALHYRGIISLLFPLTFGEKPAEIILHDNIK